MKIIDVHQHLWGRKDYATALRTAEKLRLPRVFLSCIVVAGVSLYPNKREVDTCNALCYEFCEEHSDIFRTFTYMNPVLPSSAATLREGVLHHGAKGGKLEVSAFHDSDYVTPIAEACIDLGVPLKLHTWHKFWQDNSPTESDAFRVANLAKRYPDLMIHMPHFGGDAWYNLKAVEDLPNVYADISSANRPGSDIEYAVRHLGSERIMFGTDGSAGNSVLYNLGRVEEAQISERDRENILWRTACRFYHEELTDAEC